jgi:acyl dehydratase
MTPDRKTLIGKVFQPVTYTIREEDIRDYLPVAGEDHPAFISDEGARATGYERRVIPPSFAPFVAVVALLRSFDWKRDFFLDYRTGTAMFGEQEIEYLRPLYVGETLTIQGTVTDVYEKQGKRPFDVAQVNFTATDESGTVAFRGMQSYVLFK